MTPEILARLESVLETEFDSAASNILVPNPNGGYHLFGRFDVRKHHDVIEVCRDSQRVAEFSCMRQALSWCIAEKYQQTELANSICRLDQDLRRLRNMDAVLTHLVTRIQDRDRRFVTRIKMDHNAGKLLSVQQQLTKCVARAKYLQIRGFNNEIARTRRPAPNGTGHEGTRRSGRKAR